MKDLGKMSTISNFYSELQTLSLPIPEVFRQRLFAEIPVGWYIIIADVKNSTAAVNAGRHNDRLCENHIKYYELIRIFLFLACYALLRLLYTHFLRCYSSAYSFICVKTY